MDTVRRFLFLNMDVSYSLYACQTSGSATLSGRYRRIAIPIDPALWKAVENTPALPNGNGMIMYDTILLSESLQNRFALKPL